MILADPSQYLLKAILNDDPSLTADVTLSAGQVEVFDTGNTGAPWGSPLPYDLVIAGTMLTSGSGLYIPYAAGTYGKKKFVTSSWTFVVGQTFIITVSEDATENLDPGYQQTFIYEVQSTTLATEVNAMVALINAGSNGNLTATNSGNDLVIEGNFGESGISINDFVMSINQSISQSVVTAVVQPAGTPELVKKYFPAALVTSAGYNTYGFDYTFSTGGADSGFYGGEQLVKKAIVFQNSATDVNFLAAWTDIFEGTATTADYLAKG